MPRFVGSILLNDGPSIEQINVDLTARFFRMIGRQMDKSKFSFIRRRVSVFIGLFVY